MPGGLFGGGGLPPGGGGPAGRPPGGGCPHQGLEPGADALGAAPAESPGAALALGSARTTGAVGTGRGTGGSGGKGGGTSTTDADALGLEPAATWDPCLRVATMTTMAVITSSPPSTPMATTAPVADRRGRSCVTEPPVVAAIGEELANGDDGGPPIPGPIGPPCPIAT
ncbi:MAG TPA: hypothetical protein VIF15_00190, partial [Polyangiaceae bacterium]